MNYIIKYKYTLANLFIFTFFTAPLHVYYN